VVKVAVEGAVDIGRVLPLAVKVIHHQVDQVHIPGGRPTHMYMQVRPHFKGCVGEGVRGISLRVRSQHSLTVSFFVTILPILSDF